MTNDELAGIILSSREKLGKMTTIIRGLMASTPSAADYYIPRLHGLEQRQIQLEDVWIRSQSADENLGFIFPLAIIAGSVISGLGIWAFKHYQDVTLEKDKLEAFRDCVEYRVKNNISQEEAEMTCKSLYNPDQTGTVQNISNLVKTIAISGIALIGVYVYLKKK